MDNLKLWDAVDDIDPKFTKAISGRDYSGTSPNPQYLVKLATQHLGPVGRGFGWHVVAENFEPLGDVYLHWCRIRFWWRDGDDVRDFEAYGQTKAAYTTSGGKYRVDEDAPKKSLTDAVTKALSQLGFAANIFLGRWDDNKYVSAVNAEYREAEKATPRAIVGPDEITDLHYSAKERARVDAAVARAEKKAKATGFAKTFAAKVAKAEGPLDAMQLVADAKVAIARLKEYPDALATVTAALKEHGCALTIRDGVASASEADIPDDDLPERIKDGARFMAAGE